MHHVVLKVVLAWVLCSGLVLSTSRPAYAQMPSVHTKANNSRTADQIATTSLSEKMSLSEKGPKWTRALRLSASARPLAPPSPTLRETTASPARLDTMSEGSRDRWLAMDKAKHLGGSFFVVLGGQYVFEKKAALQRDPALALSVGSGAALGLAKELYDRFLGPTRYFSIKDLAADVLGLLLGAGVVIL